MSNNDGFKTPAKTREHISRGTPGQWNEFVIPESPMLKVIGYGTGITVSLLERSSPQRSCYRSPWAVKRLSRRVQVQPAHEQRLAREAALLRRLRHPNVVGFRGVAAGPAAGTVALLMEAASASLQDLVEARADVGGDGDGAGPFPLRQIATVGHDVAAALHYLHTEQRLLHGDLKSANVLVFGEFGVAKLCDFGVSLPLDERLAVSGRGQHYVGTEPWSAPEAVHDQPVSHKTDVYAYALTLWEMFALEMPHASDLPDMSSDSDALDDDSDVDASFYDSKMGVPPPVPQYSAAVMTQYRPFVEIYTVCSAVRPADRPAAAHCVDLFRPLRDGRQLVTDSGDSRESAGQSGTAGTADQRATAD